MMLGILVVAGVVGLGGGKPEAPRVGSVPFELDHNRMIVEVELVRPDGASRKARAWVDTGNEVIIVTEAVAREMGLDVSVLDGQPGGESVATTSAAPGLRIGGLALDTSGIETRVRRGERIMPGLPAEVHVPAKVLRHDHVVFDYPARRLTVARPGALEPRGVAVPCRVNPSTGLFMVEARVDGEPVALGLDNGSSGTWVSRELTNAWQKRHPAWRHATGALGSTNFWGIPLEVDGVLMRLPEADLGTVRVHDVAVLGLPQGLFNWYSKKSAGAVAGFLGANVLRRYRLEVDFPGEMTWWEGGSDGDAGDLDIVGITVRAEDGGSYSVAGVVVEDGAPTVAGVHPGDRILKVGELEVRGATMGTVLGALRGRPGESRTLVVERDGTRITVEATVRRFP